MTNRLYGETILYPVSPLATAQLLALFPETSLDKVIWLQSRVLLPACVVINIELDF